MMMMMTMKYHIKLVQINNTPVNLI